MTTNLGFDIELPSAFSAAVSRVKEALKQEGFGILTEIGLRAAFRAKVGREFRPYILLTVIAVMAQSPITAATLRWGPC